MEVMSLSSPLSPLGGECTLLNWWLYNLFCYTLSISQSFCSQPGLLGYPNGTIKKVFWRTALAALIHVFTMNEHWSIIASKIGHYEISIFFQNFVLIFPKLNTIARGPQNNLQGKHIFQTIAYVAFFSSEMCCNLNSKVTYSIMHLMSNKQNMTLKSRHLKRFL